MAACARAWAALGLVLLAVPLWAQGADRYEAQYGTPVDVSLDDILGSVGGYELKAVRTTGQLSMSDSGRGYVLRSRFAGSARIVPVNDISYQFEQEARQWVGRDVQITGVVGSNTGSQPDTDARASTGTSGETRVVITFWGYLGPEEKVDEKKLEGAPVSTLEWLLTNPGKRDGQLVRVVGKFRGHNLYGDLPTASRRQGGDWVIKDDVYAVWVAGKKPKGKGWELDANLKRDTSKWIEVVGKPVTRRGVVYIEAVHVALSKPPSATADAAPPPPPPPRPRVPPAVVFALPLDGESDVSPDTQRFYVQFNKDMDEASFEGRVELRYVGGQRPGERLFDAVRLDYDPGRRVLIVDPGDVLSYGRELELLLLPGIVDLDGLELVPSAPPEVEGAVAVLRWYIAG
jgi:hypothetical protein